MYEINSEAFRKAINVAMAGGDVAKEHQCVRLRSDGRWLVIEALGKAVTLTQRVSCVSVVEGPDELIDDVEIRVRGTGLQALARNVKDRRYSRLFVLADAEKATFTYDEPEALFRRNGPAFDVASYHEGAPAGFDPVALRLAEDCLVLSWDIPRNVFLAALSRVEYAAGDDEGRPNIRGVHVDLGLDGVSPSALMLTATDGHRLARTTCRNALWTNTNDAASFLLPTWAIPLATAYLGGMRDDTFRVEIVSRTLIEEGTEPRTEKRVRLAPPNTVDPDDGLVFEDCCLAFPDVEKVIPFDTQHAATFDASGMLESLAAIKPATKTDILPIAVFTTADGKPAVMLNGESALMVEGYLPTAPVPGTFALPPTENGGAWGFNLGYLSEVIKVLGKGTVRMLVAAEKPERCAVQLRPAADMDTLHLVMPVLLEGDARPEGGDETAEAGEE